MVSPLLKRHLNMVSEWGTKFTVVYNNDSLPFYRFSFCTKRGGTVEVFVTNVTNIYKREGAAHFFVSRLPQLRAGEQTTSKAKKKTIVVPGIKFVTEIVREMMKL